MVAMIQFFFLILGATYGTLLIHGSWHSHKLTKAVERGLGRRLKRTAEMYWMLPLTVILAPLFSIWLLFNDTNQVVDEVADGMLENEDVSGEELRAIAVELRLYKQGLQ